MLADRFGSHVRKFDRTFIRRSHACVTAELPAPRSPSAIGHTLWHSMYAPERLEMEVNFYLGEGDGAGGIRRSGYVRFRLDPTRAPEPQAGE